MPDANEVRVSIRQLQTALASEDVIWRVTVSVADLRTLLAYVDEPTQADGVEVERLRAELAQAREQNERLREALTYCLPYAAHNLQATAPYPHVRHERELVAEFQALLDTPASGDGDAGGTG